MNNINSIRVKRNDIDTEIRSKNEETEVRDDIVADIEDDVIDIDLSQNIKELGLPGIVSNRLKKVRVNNLGDLLKLDYSDFKHIRGLGDKGISDILNYVHSLGRTVPNEHLALDYQKKQIQEQGQILLEDYGIPNSVCLPLYRAGIFTMEKLKTAPEIVEEIKYFGLKKKKILQEYLGDQVSITLTTDNSKSTALASENEVEQDIQEKTILLRKNNFEIKKRIEVKQTLVNEYLKLVAEREALIEKERELDEKLAQIRGEKIVQPKQHKK